MQSVTADPPQVWNADIRRVDDEDLAPEILHERVAEELIPDFDVVFFENFDEKLFSLKKVAGSKVLAYAAREKDS